MKIQNLLLPEVGVCTETDMFFRSEKQDAVKCDIEKSQLVFNNKYALCDFSTYFNGLSIAKWKKYTTIGDISLCLLVKGHFEVTLISHNKIDKNLYCSDIDIKRITGDGKTPVILPYKLYEYRGMLSFKLVSLEENCIFYGGWYDAEVDEKDLQEVNLAVNICTFKREPFIMRNIGLFNRNILKNPDSELFDHLHVYISDNGHTLPIDELATDKIHIVPNKNVGGAGGFSRGLIEVMKNAEKYSATHVIMMDDDVIIETESLLRTYAMLRCRKKIYDDMFVGGAMLRLDHPEIQVESGASWNEGRLISNKKGLNLNTLDACLYNEIEEYTEYNAWWYCCTPMSVVKNDNLPLPIFIRGDDLEYGLRNMKTLVLMNGICVWHEAFENKYSSFLQYYILRNLLYDNALHFPGYSKWELLSRLYRSCAFELMCYRYKNVDLLIRGLQDFFKGIDFLLNTDGEKLHKEIMDAGYKSVPIEELPYPFRIPSYNESMREGDSLLHTYFRWATINGYLLPARRTAVKDVKCVSMAACRPVNFYRQRNVINYDPFSGKAFVTSKNYREFVKCLLQMVRITFKILFSFDSAMKDFRKNSNKVQNIEFWNKYLNN